MEYTTKPISQPEVSDRKALSIRFQEIRTRTEEICGPLQTEDFVAQPITDVSPPKWHLAHTTWFFETFVLKEFSPNYKEFDETFGFHFNSYYNNEGDRVLRPTRGQMTRPSTARIFEYRAYVNDHMLKLIETDNSNEGLERIIELGLQHEMQHQELLFYDIKYILGHQPFYPRYSKLADNDKKVSAVENSWIELKEGLYRIGYRGEGFHFDNELGSHRVFLEDFSIAKKPVTFGEFIEFIEDGAYSNFNLWHSDAWDYINREGIKSPMYMINEGEEWHRYTLSGYQKIDPSEILVHVSFYEAAAFAEWKGMRLPSEFEWEAAADQIDWGDVWEWTNSAYLPYPRFSKAPGALGEYNGKFMINQMVLRGASGATTPGHSRKTYRNFFHPHLQWQFSGIRLAK